MKYLPQSYAVRALIEAAEAALVHLTPTQQEGLLEALKEFEDCTSVMSWHITDVQNRRHDMTDDEARDVLKYMYDGHGCSENDWLYLEHCAREVKP